MVGSVIVCFAVAFVASAEDFPYVPLCIFVMLYPYVSFDADFEYTFISLR